MCLPEPQRVRRSELTERNKQKRSRPNSSFGGFIQGRRGCIPPTCAFKNFYTILPSLSWIGSQRESRTMTDFNRLYSGETTPDPRRRVRREASDDERVHWELRIWLRISLTQVGLCPGNKTSLRPTEDGNRKLSKNEKMSVVNRGGIFDNLFINFLIKSWGTCYPWLDSKDVQTQVRTKIHKCKVWLHTSLIPLSTDVR